MFQTTNLQGTYPPTTYGHTHKKQKKWSLDAYLYDHIMRIYAYKYLIVFKKLFQPISAK